MLPGILESKSKYLNNRIKSENFIKIISKPTQKSVLDLNSTGPRVKTMGISMFSMMHNSLVESMTPKANTSSESSLRLPEISTRQFNEKKISEMIDKLDEVITPKPNLPDILLGEGKNPEIEMKAMNYLTFKIPVKGRKCPLFIKIRQYEGEILSYTSLTNSRPGLNANMKKLTLNYHEVFDDTAREFSSEFAFLGIKSLQDSSFKIHISFGKTKTIQDFRKISKELAYESPDISISEIISKNYQSPKNFIQANLKTNQKSLVKDKTKNNSQQWKTQMEQAKIRKKTLEKAKKKKNYDSLSKKIKKLEEEAKRMERKVRKQELKLYCKDWMKILFFAVSLDVMKKSIIRKRTETLIRIKLNQQVYIMQRFYKKNLASSSNPKAVANHSLRLYKKLIIGWVKNDVKPKIIRVISTSAHTQLLFNSVSKYLEKVLRVQRSFRRYIRKKKYRIATLRIQWIKCIDKSLYTKRSNNVRRKESLKYISIPSTTRESILLDFYAERWREFKKEIKSYMKLLTTNKMVNRMVVYPDFKFIPSDMIMENLIRKAISYKEKN
ncbi:hypothetical protein SteCoe_25960 [Stentor coeruleus]|uniref:Uncharacterized protein n=1 Tax=Stentor coeruleus TaxID=5963 RepID=A0A1R2BDZ9_9CILI|nr:hypothetical protein SteCoe_25960 [Stentor coeruleus]